MTQLPITPVDGLPLFPLRQPLFPGVPLKLQIFEQRYLRLVRESIGGQQPFGIVPILRGREVGAVPEIYHWGTLVTIRDWHQLDNGLLGITVQGEERIQVESPAVDSDGLMRASVRIFGPDPDEPLHGDDEDLLALLNDLARELNVPGLIADDSISVSTLGWRLLWLLPLDMQWRLDLFEEDDPERRLRAIRQQLVAMSRN